MTYEINGRNGKYDSIVTDSSIKYGRNSVENHYNYMEQPLVNDKMTTAPILNFSQNNSAVDENIEALENFVDENDKYLKSLPPLEYEYRYMPQVETGKVDNKAVLGAAYEELGAKEMNVEEFEERFMIDESMTAEPLDINKDGKIDIAEYGANILATDLLSKNDVSDFSKINGSVNTKGMNSILEYTLKANAEAAAKLYSNIYNTYNLGSTLDSFKAE